MFITMKPECLKAMLPFVSKEETRYYFNGVYIEKGILVATDGHKLAALKPDHWAVSREPDGNAGPFILPTETIKKILGVKPESRKLPMFVTLDTTNNRATVHHGGYPGSTESGIELASFAYKPVDGTYPDWKRVIPAEDKFKAPKQASFNAAYLGLFQSLGNSLIIKLNEDPTAPCIIQAKTNDWEAFGVLMPMRDDIPEVFPKWVKK